jgi:uncharacterized membrane protein YczE
MRSRPDRPRAGNPDLTVLGFPGAAELKRRLPRLFLGLLALGSGTGMMVEAELGVSPYDVLHQGLADLTGLSFGTVVIGLGAIILLLWIPLGQRFGIGTVINTLVVGLIIDAFLELSPNPDALALRWVYLVAGIVIVAFGVGLYIGAGLGPGPRDGLMTGIAAKGYPLWLVRTGLELTALVAGWVLGGDVGVGTLLFAFGIGPLGHYFLLKLHLGVGGGDPDPDATIGE